MDIKEWSFASFHAPILALPDSFELGVSRASIVESGKKLLPDNFNQEKNVDLLPVVFNLAVVNKFNSNGDGIDADTAIEAIKLFANKPINCEHKKDKIVGHILSATLSFDENDFSMQDPESFRGEEKPFYIKASGVVYRHVFPKLCQAIVEASDPESDNYESISTSWEIGFKKSKFVVYQDSPIVSASTIVADSDVKQIKTNHRAFGGKGKDLKGNNVARIIIGEILPLGAGLTYNPAAEVKGVFIIPDEKIENKKEKKQTKNSLIAENAVRIEKFKEILNMDKKQFDEFLQKLEQSAASVFSEESQAKSVGLLMKDALTEYSKVWETKVSEEKEAAVKAKASLSQLETSFEEVQKELKEIKAEQEIKAASDLFNARMNFIEANYTFTEDETKLVIQDIKTVEASDEAFEAFKNKLSVLFSHKSKASILAQKEEIAKQIEEEVVKRTSKTQEATASDTSEEKDVAAEEALAQLDAQGNVIPNNSQEASAKESLVEKLKKSFSVNIKL